MDYESWEQTTPSSFQNAPDRQEIIVRRGRRGSFYMILATTLLGKKKHKKQNRVVNEMGQIQH